MNLSLRQNLFVIFPTLYHNALLHHLRLLLQLSSYHFVHLNHSNSLLSPFKSKISSLSSSDSSLFFSCESTLWSTSSLVFSSETTLLSESDEFSSLFILSSSLSTVSCFIFSSSS